MARTMTRDERRAVLDIMGIEFYKCPTNGTILEKMRGDDKVLCGCGKSNPRVPREGTEQTATHMVRFLDRATVDEYMEQEEKRWGHDDNR